MNQGWCECNNNEMCFCPCRFNIPRLAHQISNHADAITGERNEISLNPIAEPCVCSDDLKDHDNSVKDCKIEGKRCNKEDGNNKKKKD